MWFKRMPLINVEETKGIEIYITPKGNRNPILVWQSSNKAWQELSAEKRQSLNNIWRDSFGEDLTINAQLTLV